MDEPCLKLPPKVTRQVLEKHKRPGEPVVLVVAKGIGSTQPFELCDREGRSYLLVWDAKLDGHVLRFPQHVWMRENAKVALGLMEQRRMTFPLVVLVEWEKEDLTGGRHRRGNCASCCGGESDDGGHRRDACAPYYEGGRRDEELRRMLGGGAVRVKVAAAELGMDEAVLRSWLDKEGAPARLIQGGWVKLKS